MFRTFILLILAILLIPLIRMVIGTLARALFLLLGQTPSHSPAGPRPPGHSSAQRFGGMLHKDPVCGKFISENSAIRSVQKGETYFFCSEQCRNKFRQSS